MVQDSSGNGVVEHVGGGPSTKRHTSGHMFAITPSDTVELTHITREIYVGGAGDVAVEGVDGDQVTFPNVPAGGTIHAQARKVLSTGTDATSLVGLG